MCFSLGFLRGRYSRFIFQGPFLLYIPIFCALLACGMWRYLQKKNFHFYFSFSHFLFTFFFFFLLFLTFFHFFFLLSFIFLLFPLSLALASLHMFRKGYIIHTYIHTYTHGRAIIVVDIYIVHHDR